MAPLKIIGAGYGRTGTRSLCQALDTLGYDFITRSLISIILIKPHSYSCHHMEKVILDPDQDPKVFSDAYASGNHPEWDEVFKAYDAAVDWPSAAFWKELSQNYPDAKVILTVRDPEEWYDSTSKTIYDWEGQGKRNGNGEFENLPDKLVRLGELSQVMMKNGVLKDFKNRESMVRQFQQHIIDVKETISPERLLVLELDQGWDPLCKFLGIDVPKDIPYPHSNKREDFGKKVFSYKGELESH